MTLNTLTAISPIDGRYRTKVTAFASYFSEEALIRYRIRVEVEYFIALCQIPLPQLKSFDHSLFPKLRNLYLNFSSEDAHTVKAIEKEINHDVKAVEYFVKRAFDKLGISAYKEFIHFGLTSQDINNTAIPLSIKEAITDIYLPVLNELSGKLKELVIRWEAIPMLARTHGQPASPTRLGKELQVFVERIDQQEKVLIATPFAAKFGGATGNYNAHKAAYPKVDWKSFGTKFVEYYLGLHHSFPTTQIEHYDHLAALFDCLKRINTILIDLNRDFWTYISMDYFKQKINPGEVGSSAMPHKVNPIDFENSEGNLGVANAIFEHFSGKLPVSRLQRDLTDSTVLRNVGVPLAHTVIGFKATLNGLDKLVLNGVRIEQDLENSWVVVGEAIQNVLRREGYPNPYETLKDLTRTNTPVTQQLVFDFIDTLNISKAVKEELKQIRPENYTGV